MSLSVETVPLLTPLQSPPLRRVTTFETRFNYHVKALGNIGLGLGLVGVTVETRQTSIGALETNLVDQFQSLQSIVDGNSNSITDLEMSSSSMGVTVEIIQTSIDALDTNLDGQLQSLNETVNINSIAITTLGDDIKTCFNYHRNVLGDLGLGLGLVGVTVQTLQTSLDALDTNIEGQLQTINEGVNKTVPLLAPSQRAPLTSKRA